MAKLVIAGERIVARDIEVARRFSAGDKPSDGEFYDFMKDIRNGKRTFQMYDLGGRRFGARLDAMDQHSMLVIATNQRIGSKNVFLDFKDVLKVTQDGCGNVFVYVDKFIEERKVEVKDHAAPSDAQSPN